jgi:iron-sulfur cluster assembly protein
LKGFSEMEVIDTPKTINNSPISFTDGAKAELLRLINTLNISDEQGLRIGVKGGGCAGLSYILAFDHKEENDNVYNFDGIKVLMNKTSLMYLVGMQVDWEDGLNNKGFTFSNPNAQDTCGCGTSFST